MIDPTGLASAPRDRRAAIIYGAAQAEMSKHLWRAALGGSGGGSAGSRDESLTMSGRDTASSTSLDSLIALLIPEAKIPTTTPDPVAGAAEVRARFATADLGPPVHRHAVDPDQHGASPAPDGLGPNARHAPILQAAAARTGIPAAALAAIVDAEAGKARDGTWQTYSRNPRSSAAGLGQFLSRTWEGMAETGGTWLNGLARANGWLGDNGQVLASARATVLSLRYDPTAAINGIADFAKRNLDGLDRAGVSAHGEVGATARLAYLGHHLGLGDAVRFMRDGGLSKSRAHTLLDAQIGTGDSSRRIASTGDATIAHRNWLLDFMDRKIRPQRFANISA